MNTLLVERVAEKASSISKATIYSAGYDLTSPYSYVLQSNSQIIIDTNLKIKLPKHTVGLLQSRSGLAAHHGITVKGGVIDEDFRGIVKIILFNTGPTYHVAEGDKVAQLLVLPILHPKIKFSRIMDTTCRAESGLGSSGR